MFKLTPTSSPFLPFSFKVELTFFLLTTSDNDRDVRPNSLQSVNNTFTHHTHTVQHHVVWCNVTVHVSSDVLLTDTVITKHE